MPFYTFARAFFYALVTFHALFIVDFGQTVVHGDRARRAYLCAERACDASSLAKLHYVFTLSVVGAGNIHLRALGNTRDYIFGTVDNARAARNALFGIDVRISLVVELYRVVRTDVDARFQTDTADGARFDAARNQFAGLAVSVTVVIVFIIACVSAVAVNHGNGLFAHVAAAEQLCDLFFVRRRRGFTVGYGNLALDERLGKLGAPRLTATAAIRLGEKIFHFLHLGVLFNGKDARKYNEDYAENDGEREHNSARN